MDDQEKELKVPKEAHEIAGQFDAMASQIREVAGRMRTTGGILEAEWEGNSANLFMGLFTPEFGNLESYANWLNERAGEIRNIKVWM